MGLYGWRLLTLIGAAVIGGYALATATGICLGAVLPLPRGESVVIGNLLSFAVYAGTTIWAFTVRRPGRVWMTLLVSTGILLGIGLLVGA